MLLLVLPAVTLMIISNAISCCRKKTSKQVAKTATTPIPGAPAPVPTVVSMENCSEEQMFAEVEAALKAQANRDEDAELQAALKAAEDRKSKMINEDEIKPTVIVNIAKPAEMTVLPTKVVASPSKEEKLKVTELTVVPTKIVDIPKETPKEEEKIVEAKPKDIVVPALPAAVKESAKSKAKQKITESKDSAKSKAKQKTTEKKDSAKSKAKQKTTEPKEKKKEIEPKEKNAKEKTVEPKAKSSKEINKKGSDVTHTDKDDQKKGKSKDKSQSKDKAKDKSQSKVGKSPAEPPLIEIVSGTKLKKKQAEEAGKNTNTSLDTTMIIQSQYIAEDEANKVPAAPVSQYIKKKKKN